MKRRMKIRRRFDGKTYVLARTTSSKSTANDLANDARRIGYLARIVKRSKGFSVYLSEYRTIRTISRAEARRRKR